MIRITFTFPSGITAFPCVWFTSSAKQGRLSGGCHYAFQASVESFFLARNEMMTSLIRHSEGSAGSGWMEGRHGDCDGSEQRFGPGTLSTHSIGSFVHLRDRSIRRRNGHSTSGSTGRHSSLVGTTFSLRRYCLTDEAASIARPQWRQALAHHGACLRPGPLRIVRLIRAGDVRAPQLGQPK